MDTKHSKNRSRLNPAFRIDAKLNSRRWGDGDPIEYATFVDARNNLIVRTLDQETADGGTMTPFNILCNAVGACAVKRIIFDGDETIVLFADGDKVVVKRHPDDKNDPITAMLWALGEKVFGADLSKQIKRAIKYRSSDREALHAAKAAKPELAKEFA